MLALFAGFVQTGYMSDPTDSKNAPLGVISANVACHVEEVRQAAHLSLRGLSDRLLAIGWPMVPSVLHRIVQGKRRCGPDDVVALALALDVSVSSLLLPIHVTRDDIVQLTPDIRQRANIAWDWADGRFPLPLELLPEGTTSVSNPGERVAFFQTYGRPDITSPEPDPAIEELMTLARMLQTVQSTPAAERAGVWAHWRDTILRRFELAAIQFEELAATEDREMLDAARTEAGAEFRAAGLEFGMEDAVTYLRDVRGRVRKPSIQFTPGTTERYAASARADRERLRDPFGEQDGDR